MKSLRRINVLFQLSDGSSINIFCLNIMNSILIDFDDRFELSTYLKMSKKNDSSKLGRIGSNI